MKELIRNKAFIGGQWSSAVSSRTFAVVNPYDGDTLTHIPDMDEKDTLKAIEAAHEAFQAWQNTTAGWRAELMDNWYDLILENLRGLSRVITLEQGKPLKEAEGEVKYGASFIKWFAQESLRLYGDIIPTFSRSKRILVIKQPIGVVAAITPWNFPVAMITRKIAPALAAGCTVVLKPAEETPLSALALAELGHQAGLPPGTINVITTSNPAPVGKLLCTHPLVRKLTFTGSTEVGKKLMTQCGSTAKKVSLEMGGNAPFIIFEDADLECALEGAVASKYRNAGQTCICANRFYVHDSVYDVFAEMLAQRVSRLKTGSGLNADVQIGPLINQQALEKVSSLVREAIAKGSKSIVANTGFEKTGVFYPPTVLTGVTEDMAISKTEIFGPVAALYRFGTDDEAIRLANNTSQGLAAYFYSRDIGRIFRVAEALEYGMVGVNTGEISHASIPFGGVKESGIGREGSKYGLDEFVEIKYICLGDIDK